jgi:hypothetical protein
MRGVNLPIRVQRAFDNFGLLITTGFLPQRFRDEMKLDWNPGMQRRFDRTIGVLRFVNHLMPRFIRQFPFNVLLKDLDWRIRTGRPLVCSRGVDFFRQTLDSLRPKAFENQSDPAARSHTVRLAKTHPTPLARRCVHPREPQARSIPLRAARTRRYGYRADRMPRVAKFQSALS